jgi:hypothetical protein
MPELTIGDKTVTVGDEFLKLSPDQQNATVQQIAAQIGLGAPTSPVSTSDVARAAATGVPIIGGALNKLDAATNAALAPLLNRFFGSEDQLPEASFGERYAHSLRDQEAADKRFATEHPVIDTAAQLAGGAAAMGPVMAAAPEAFGLAGTLPQMVSRGAASGAALSAADAATRGENPVDAAVTGGIVGGAAGPVGKGVGKVVSSIADRVRPAPTVPQNVVNVGGVDVPLSQSQATQNPVLSAEEQVILRGGRGEPAQARAQAFKDLQDTAIEQARGDIGARLNSSRAKSKAVSTSPYDAAEKVAAELIAQEQARQAADAARAVQVGQEGDALARSLDAGGTLRTPSAFEAGETLSDRLALARNAAKADYRSKYAAVGEAPGEFAPGSAAGFGNDVRNGLTNADQPISQLDETNHKRSLQALDVIDRRLNAVGPGRPQASADLGAEHAQNVEAVRKKYGEQVAAAYDRQKQEAAAPLSLLQFIASKGGLRPDAELEAIGLATGHRAQIPGRSGFFGVVSKNGVDLDRMREAAEEAGYLRSAHPDQTTTTRDLLDAIDAELRGQKRYPEGYEGHQTKRESAARSELDQHEQDQFTRGLEDDLTDAGHGGLAPDVKQHAVRLMADEGLDADTAVEHALLQLEQEDAAGFANSSKRAETGPLPEPAAPKAAGAVQFAENAKKSPSSGFTMKDVEQVRKELVSLYRDARRAMMAGGSGSDVYALEHIMEQFDARVEQMVEQGKFSGDGPAVLQMQREARASFADYKQKFSKRGAGDEVGAAVEKILGKFSDTKATPDTVVKLAYGSGSVPGGQMPVQIAQRIATIFGRDSAEFDTFKQGLFHQLIAGEPEKAAARIDEFLTGTKGRLLAQTVFDAGERARLAQYANRLRSIAPQGKEAGPTAAVLRRIVGADGGAPASASEIVNHLYGPSGKVTGRLSVPLALELKATLPKKVWDNVRQGMWEKLTSAGEGKVPFGPQALSQRLHEFLNESGSQLSKVLYTAKERKLMASLAAVYKQMIPVAGTTNPSGTAPMLARMASGLRHTLLPLLGLTHGGLPGAAVGAVADKGLTAISNANNARKATELFYGSQARRPVDPRFAKVAGLLAQGSLPALNESKRHR